MDSPEMRQIACVEYEGRLCRVEVDVRNLLTDWPFSMLVRTTGYTYSSRWLCNSHPDAIAIEIPNVVGSHFLLHVDAPTSESVWRAAEAEVRRQHAGVEVQLDASDVPHDVQLALWLLSLDDRRYQKYVLALDQYLRNRVGKGLATIKSVVLHGCEGNGAQRSITLVLADTDEDYWNFRGLRVGGRRYYRSAVLWQLDDLKTMEDA